MSVSQKGASSFAVCVREIKQNKKTYQIERKPERKPLREPKKNLKRTRRSQEPELDYSTAKRECIELSCYNVCLNNLIPNPRGQRVCVNVNK